MGGTELIPLKYQKAASIIYYVFVVLLGVLMLLVNATAILAASGLTQVFGHFTQTECFFLLSASIALTSVLVWFGMILGVFKTNERFERLVSRAFITGVFGAILLGVKKALE